MYFNIKRLIGFLILLIFLYACGSSNTGKRVQSWEELNSLVNERNFRIENDWANPLGGENINLMTNPNFIEFKGDSVEVFLPYFGVRHSGGGYGQNNGIKYEGIARNLEISEDRDKRRIVMEFEAKEDSEDLDFRIQLYASGKTYTSVNSTQRSNISYDGEVLKMNKD